MIEDMQDEAVQVETAKKSPQRRRREGITLALWILIIETARQAMSKFSVEKFDDKRGPTWHCIVGRNFGSFVTHETKHFIYFYLGHCAILLFKTQ
ncbi:dynein light chain protein [Rutstroemia sp. NJR-2017a BVV2]|nr:dynein light chain protein [Rutstroemia sp. NJR-2017a BVV2]